MANIDLLENLKEAVNALNSLENILRDINPCKYCNFNPRHPEPYIRYFKDEFYKNLNDVIAQAEEDCQTNA